MKALGFAVTVVFSLLRLSALPGLGQTPSSTTTTVDFGSGGSTGLYTSQAIVAGNPAIAYYNNSDLSLMFARNSAADGSGAWTVTTVDRIGQVGLYASLAVISGVPCIAYLDNTNHVVKFARNSAADGSGTWTISTVDDAGTIPFPNTVGYITLATVGGNPAVSYYHFTNQILKFARNATADGSGAWVVTTVDGTTGVGQFASLAILSTGRPAISYFDATNGALKFARNNQVDGLGIWTISVADSGGSLVGRYTALAMIAGNPAVCYQDGTNGQMKFARNSMPDGSGSWAIAPVATPAGNETSLKVLSDGRPAIAYRDSGSTLQFARNSTADGSGSWTSVTVSAVATSLGKFPSTGILSDGRPVISHYDGHLQFSVNSATDGGGTWTSATVDSGFEAGNVGKFTSQALVNGTPAIVYYEGSQIKLARNTAPDGSGIWNISTITASSSSTVGPSLAVIGGYPAIIYYDGTQAVYLRNTAVDGSGSWYSSLSFVQEGVSCVRLIACADGTPGIGYRYAYTDQFQTFHTALKFVRNTAIDGSGSWTFTTVDTTSNLGTDFSLAVVNGNPAVSYYLSTLRFARSSTADGSGVWTSVTANTTAGSGRASCLALLNGKPVISHTAGTTFGLLFSRSSAVDGLSGWSTGGVAGGNVGQYNSTFSVDAYPAISYYDTTNHVLKFARNNNADGSGGTSTSWTTITADLPSYPLDSVGLYNSMIKLPNGKLAISYQAAGKGNLKWATIGFSPELIITSTMRASNGHFMINGQFAPNALVTIKAAPDSVSPPMTIGTAMCNGSGVFQFDDIGAVGQPRQFYRAAYP